MLELTGRLLLFCNLPASGALGAPSEALLLISPKTLLRGLRLITWFSALMMEDVEILTHYKQRTRQASLLLVEVAVGNSNGEVLYALQTVVVDIKLPNIDLDQSIESSSSSSLSLTLTFHFQKYNLIRTF